MGMTSALTAISSVEEKLVVSEPILNPSTCDLHTCDLYADTLFDNHVSMSSLEPEFLFDIHVGNSCPNVANIDFNHASSQHEPCISFNQTYFTCLDMCVTPDHSPEGAAITNADLPRLNPLNLAAERKATWPDISGVPNHVALRYNNTRSTGLPNVLHARTPIQSSLCNDEWRAAMTGHHDDAWLCDLLEHGFPLQYTGYVPESVLVDNHSSAARYPDHVAQYIRKELDEGALLGPFRSHPFPTSGHTNPLMSRPKADPAQRRIIVDLSFPPGVGINSKVYKGCVFGTFLPHKLPTVQQALAVIRARNLDVLMAVIDIERAYRNFRGDPLDWPLSVIQYDNSFYIDVALPFGARMSSLCVQKVAEFINRALSQRGIQCLIYLDDLFLFLPTDGSAYSKFNQALAFLRSLGLPVNFSKLISPTTHAVWLGVLFDLSNNTISIPHNKVNDLLTAIQAINDREYITRTEAQSILGRMAHIARVVHPARLFMCRILHQLRISGEHGIYITPAVRADCNWFSVYFRDHNASTIIPSNAITLTIEADACLAAGGAWDSRGRYYIFPFSEKLARTHNICQLEAINYLVALRTFGVDLSPGARIEIYGDNEGAISALSSGRACDLILASVARAIWFHASARQIEVVFTHKPGQEIAGADALSRAVLSSSHSREADRFVAQKQLVRRKAYPSFSNYQKFL